MKENQITCALVILSDKKSIKIEIIILKRTI